MINDRDFSAFQFTEPANIAGSHPGGLGPGHSSDATRQPRVTPPRGRTIRIDAHCHSHASSGPAMKALGLIGVPECYSPPEEVYEQAMARGMDLFTITDHDTIDGVMELVRRGFQNVIVGEEVTVHFPEDRCKLHVLVWTLRPEQHDEIGRLNLRSDVYAFAAWLRQHNLPHALAHPLYIQNARLTRWHLDRCALLFKGFETLNGAHTGTHRTALDTYLHSLTPGRVHRLIQEHGLEPLWSRIWEKAQTGGSDDHGLLNVGRTWTAIETDTAPGRPLDGAAFFRTVMTGRCQPDGQAGHSALLAHQLTTVASHWAGDRLLPKLSPVGQEAMARVLRLAGVDAPRPNRLRLVLDFAKRRTIGRLSKRLRGRRSSPVKPFLAAVGRAMGPVLAKHPDLARRMTPDAWSDGAPIAQHDAMAGFVDDLHAAVHNLMADGAVRALRSRDKSGIVDHLISYILLELVQVPYLFSLFHQNKERHFVERIEHESAEPGSGKSVLERPMKVVLFTDTLGDVNGVSRFIRNASEEALAAGRDLTVVTSTRFKVPDQSNIVNFDPIFATKMPKYENLELALPPLAKMLRYIDQMQPDAVHISTPGPVGTVGLIAAKMLGVPVLGTYHTDFPAYIDHLFEDEALTWICQKAMSAFYAPFANIFTRSDDYAGSLVKLGIPRGRILHLKPGIRTSEFDPGFEDRSIWSRIGADPNAKHLLFVGRVSVEKNLPMLTKVWRAADAKLKARGVNAQLVIVGDGPYRATMEEELANTNAAFLGFRHGVELSTIYASADGFLFPSTTDTLGQVVMEAQSAGLPVLVTDKGGPKEVVQDGITGHVIPDEDFDSWVEHVIQLVVDDDRRAQMSRAAHESIKPFSIANSFEDFWLSHENAWRTTLANRGITPRSHGHGRMATLTPDGVACPPTCGSTFPPPGGTVEGWAPLAPIVPRLRAEALRGEQPWLSARTRRPWVPPRSAWGRNGNCPAFGDPPVAPPPRRCGSACAHVAETRIAGTAMLQDRGVELGDCTPAPHGVWGYPGSRHRAYRRLISSTNRDPHLVEP